ncbi:hypothetical protein GOBAR_AA13800 [Gossypium barbadense]|uniref:DUF4283 domain-containing protein n=1 Tax=Gossypium barbadense TaxID=3634 RepID=A0A2P5XU16_GOSBA|nr:hypothetical protein GOBAR_AA13800 [Gossypium barbadense]
MAEELVALSIEGGEDEAWQIKMGKEKGEISAIGKTLANLWHPLRGVMIVYLGKKRFLFRFYYEINLDRVAEGTPLTFNNHLLALHRLKTGEDLMQDYAWEKELLFVRDLSIKALPRRAMVPKFVGYTRRGMLLGGQDEKKMRGIEGSENMDPNLSIGVEKCSMEIE